MGLQFYCCCACNGQNSSQLNLLCSKGDSGGQNEGLLLSFPTTLARMSTVIHIPLAWKMLWTPIKREHVQTNLFSGSLLSALMQALEISLDINLTCFKMWKQRNTVFSDVLLIVNYI